MLLAPWPAKVLRYKKFKAVLAEDGAPLFRGPRCGEGGVQGGACRGWLAPVPWAQVRGGGEFKAVLAEDGSPLFRGPRCGEEGSSRRCLQRMACPCSVGSGATVCGGGAHLVSHVLTWGHTAH